MRKITPLILLAVFFALGIILFGCKKEGSGNHDALQNSSWKFTTEVWSIDDGNTIIYPKDQSYTGIPYWNFLNNNDFKMIGPTNSLLAFGQWSKSNDQLVVKLKYTETDTFHVNLFNIVELSNSTMKLDVKNQHAEVGGNRKVTSVIYEFTKSE